MTAFLSIVTRYFLTFDMGLDGIFPFLKIAGYRELEKSKI